MAMRASLPPERKRYQICIMLQCRLKQSTDRPRMTEDTNLTPYNPMIRDLRVDMKPRALSFAVEGAAEERHSLDG